MHDKIWRYNSKGLLAAYGRATATPSTVMTAVLAQVERHNPTLNAFCHLDLAAAQRAATASTRRWQQNKPMGPLDGIPVTIKDWYDVRGWPTRQGSRTTDPTPKKTDSFVVTALRDAGAIIIGKTTLPEFGHKGVTHGPLSGITRNPWNPDYTPGGSSGGAAVAAATGMGWLHLGSDAGGSIRIPAAFSGVVGFKPSPGLMPGWPPSAFSTLSSMGPLARSVDDCALLTRVLAAAAQKNPADWHNVDGATATCALREPSLSQRRLRIAVIETLDDMTMTAEARQVWDRQKRHLRILGTVTTITPDLPALGSVFNDHWTAVASLIASGIDKKAYKKLDPRFVHWAERGDQQHLHSYIMAEYQRMIIGGAFKQIFAKFDLIATPTTPFPAFKVGIDMPNDKQGRPVLNWNIFNAFANLARLPAISLPLGLTDAGLPFGLQLCGAYLYDGLVLAAARKLEKAINFTPWLQR